jgi:outer membrane protein assembly factor BamD (BamD/ComL family)
VAVSIDHQFLADADAKFEKKQFADALKAYQSLANSSVYSLLPTGRMALYRIGYLHIAYDNPNADPKAALSAFKLFVQKYPADNLAGYATTWIKLLSVIGSFQEQLDENATRVRKLQNKISTTSDSIAVLSTSLKRCSALTDSLDAEHLLLLKKINDYEQTIVKMEKSR